MVWGTGVIHPTVWIVWLSDVAASHFENSLSAASMAGSLTVGRSQVVAQLLTVRQRHSLQEAARLAVTKRRVVERGVVPGLQRALGPAGARQNSGARHFEHPGAGLRAILGVGLDDKGDVRVGPIDLLDGAFHRLRVVEIVGGIRMVRRCDAAETQHQTSSKNNGLRRHRDHSYFAFLFRCVNRSVRALCVRDEYVVAELILARDQVLLLALALGDFIMPIGVAAKN